MTEPTPDQGLEEGYAHALGEFLEGGGEPALHRAQELGRIALARGLGLLDMVAVHHVAVSTLVGNRLGRPLSQEVVDASGVFFAECLAPFEMTHRGVQDAVEALRGLNEAMEAEARRVARSLHDEANQSLAAALIALGTLREDLPPDVRQRLASVKTMLEEADHRLRHISHELRPSILDDLGLRPALEFLAEGVTERTGLEIAVTGVLDDRLDPDLETALYRATQEAVANVVRHARARRVLIRIDRAEGVLRCSIADDGDGFDVAAAAERRPGSGMGLRGIHERMKLVGGVAQLESHPGRGTEVRLVVPMEERR